MKAQFGLKNILILTVVSLYAGASFSWTEAQQRDGGLVYATDVPSDPPPAEVPEGGFPQSPVPNCVATALDVCGVLICCRIDLLRFRAMLPSACVYAGGSQAPTNSCKDGQKIVCCREFDPNTGTPIGKKSTTASECQGPTKIVVDLSFCSGIQIDCLATLGLPPRNR